MPAPDGPSADSGHLSIGSHLISARQLSRQGLESLIQLAAELEPAAQGRMRTDVLSGAVLANLFFEPSTRSRISFGAAFNRLGGRVLDTSGIEVSSLAKGESLADTARVVSGYVDAIVLRHPQPRAAAAFASASLVPVINGGDGDGEHPTQALTDLYTISKELGQAGTPVDGARVAMVGDLRFGRTTHSLLLTLSAYEGMTFLLLSPPGFEMPPQYTATAIERGHRVVIAKTLAEAMDGAHVVYMTRYQEERFEQATGLPREIDQMRLNTEAYSRFGRPGAVIMHPLPRSPSVGEVATDLDTNPKLAIFRQTDNGVPIRMALFCSIFGVDKAQIRASLEGTQWPLRKRLGPDASA